MSIEPDSKLYQACERAFLSEITRTIDIVVSRSAGLSKEEKEKLVGELVFAVAAHLSGSSFGGRVADEEVYPKLGFYHGEKSDALVAGASSQIHALVPEVLAEVRAIK